MDKLIETRSCPGLSYLNTTGQAMAILKIGLSGLELSMDPNTEEWLLSKVLKGTMYMKAAMNWFDVMWRYTIGDAAYVP